VSGRDAADHLPALAAIIGAENVSVRGADEKHLGTAGHGCQGLNVAARRANWPPVVRRSGT
jgi:hypothetical protein